MRSSRRRKKVYEVKELDITSFMNLMIVLVPVLLMSMVFNHVTVLDLKLPDGAASDSPQEEENQSLELVIHPDHMDLNYTAGIRLKRIEKIDDEYDYKMLSTILQEAMSISNTPSRRTTCCTPASAPE